MPQGNSLYDVEYFSSSIAIAVGTACTVIMTGDGGSSWAVTPNAAGLSETLRAVCMIDALTAIAVGEGGTIIRTTDGGITWAAQASGTSVSLYDVTFTSANTGYAVGGSGTVLKTTDGGAGWNPLSSGSGALLFGVNFVHPDIGTVVGSEGTILRTTDGGSSWASQISGTTVTLYAVQCINVNTGYAVGRNLVLKTTDGGATWNTLATPYWWNPTLEDLSFIDGDVGFIVGNIPGDDQPAIFISTEDGGSSWSSTKLPNHMFGVSRLDHSRGLAVGKMGVIRWTSNVGMTWPVVGGPAPEYYPTFMGGLDFCDIYKGVAVTSTNRGMASNTSTVLRTADGGVTWSGIQVGTGMGIRLLDIAYADETTVYAVGHGIRVYDYGGVVYRSSDGGATWEEVWSVLCWPLNPECISSFYGIDFGDPNHGVAVGTGYGIVTIRNGNVGYVATGTYVTLSEVSMPDAATVFAVGSEGTILRSTNGGDTWVPQVSGVSVSLNGVHFSDANNGTVVGSDGTILRTSNGGADWYSQTSGTTDNLSRVSFFSPLVGFIVGRSGTILNTTDGGATWTAELSPTGELMDVHTINQYNLTIVGGHWNILAKRNETVPNCVISPSAINFGSVKVNTPVDKTFIITNTGGGPLTGFVEESCDHYSIIAGGGFYSLAPGEAVSVTIRFKPTEIGHFTCSIETGSIICSDVYCEGVALERWVWDGIPICTTPESQCQPNIAMIESDKAIVVWLDNRLNESIFAQKVDIWGNFFWPENGVEIVRNPGIDPEFWNCCRPQIVPDEIGGAFIIFDGCVSFPDAGYLYVQRVNENGIIQWPQPGIELESGSWPGTTRAVSDGQGGALVVCCGWATGGHDIFVYQVESPGTINPNIHGFNICSANGVQFAPQLIPEESPSGPGAIVVWEDGRDVVESGSDIYAQKAVIIDDYIDTDWKKNGVSVCNELGDQEFPQLVPDGVGGAIITWDDARSGEYHIYAQRVDYEGNCLWDTNGIPIITASGMSNYWPLSNHQITSDGTGGAIIAWDDSRSGHRDIYVQRIDSLGIPLWMANGEPVCIANGDQKYCRIINNGRGEFIITWQDGRSGSIDVYAQKVDILGNVLWIENGIIISAANGSQGWPCIASDNYGGAMITWQDNRSGNYDVYVQRVCELVAPVATLLQSNYASIEGTTVIVNWVLSVVGEDMQFFVLRSENEAGVFEELHEPKIEVSGLSFTFSDSYVETGNTYTYRVEVLDEEERRILFETDPIYIPSMPLTLYQNHPNPFNPTTTIRYFLPHASWVTLEIYDVAGRRITRLVNEDQTKEIHSVKWNGKNMNGNSVSSGIYFYRLKAGKETISRKMVFLR